MSTSSPGAGYLRPPKRSGTREEVLAGLFAHLDKTLGTQYEVESKEQREQRLMDELWSNRVWQDNYEASFRPAWQTVGPRQPDYTEERRYIGRYGHTRMD